MNKQGFIQTVYTESAEAYEAHTLETLLKDVNSKEVLADKAYDTADNRNLLKSRNIKDRILRKAVRNKPIIQRQKVKNILISKIRYKIEQYFGRLKRGFNFAKASYFSTVKVQAQALLKSCCFNIVKSSQYDDLVNLSLVLKAL